jgi:hypothetical protein
VPNGDNGADIERREVPYSANCPTAQDNNGGAPSASLPPFGTLGMMKP